MEMKSLECKLRRGVKYLSSDLLEGRGLGSVGGSYATEWISQKMEELHLDKLVGLNSYRQEVNLVLSELNSTKSELKILAGNMEFDLLGNSESVVCCDFHEDIDTVLCTDVVYVGYGIYAPELQWNDYENVVVHGKVVVVMLGVPDSQNNRNNSGDKSLWSAYSSWSYRRDEAKSRGARAIIFLHDTTEVGYTFETVRSSIGGKSFSLVEKPALVHNLRCVIWLTRGLVDTIFSILEYSYQELLSFAKNQQLDLRQFSDVKFFSRIMLNQEFLSENNVVGYIPGTDRADEYILIMAHWDHLGILKDELGRNQIHNGAVDNASGLSMLMCMAELFSLKPRLNRSLLFLSTTAEEVGHLGAQYFSRDPTIAATNIVAGFNIDGHLPLGKTKDFEVVGWGLTDMDHIIEDVVKRHNKYVQPDRYAHSGSYYKSDHIVFARCGIPMVQFVSGFDLVEGGEDKGFVQYSDFFRNNHHSPRDVFDPNWDFSGLAEDVTIIYDIVRALGTTTYNPSFQIEI